MQHGRSSGQHAKALLLSVGCKNEVSLSARFSGSQKPNCEYHSSVITKTTSSRESLRDQAPAAVAQVDAQRQPRSDVRGPAVTANR